jgi:hypothetical protein
MYLHKVENRSTSQGVAEVSNINVLVKLSKIRATGQEVILELHSGKPVDYLPNNLIWHLCSERMRNVLDDSLQRDDDYKWITVTVIHQGQRLPYFALWFPTVPDVLANGKTLLIEGQDYVRIPVFRAEAVENRSLVIFERSDMPRLYVSEMVKRILLNAGCTGIVYSRYEISGALTKPKLPPLIMKSYKAPDTLDESKLACMQLPNDLQTFLSLRKQLKYKASNCIPGRMVLKALSDLELSEVWTEPLHNDDPHYGEKGYYAIPAVSLVHECEGYDPEFILAWLPQDKLFGTWDSDHWNLKVFPEADWKSIVNNPIPFINAQWDPDSKVSQNFTPWSRYEFNYGKPF